MIPIKSSGDEPLEALLNKATNPLNTEEDWLSINGFCDRLNEELEGPVLAVKLLAHKLQSPQEKEALYALTVLEMCVQRCGHRFHQEIGKFRFLNEIIKVISPKYLGQYTTERVKQRCVAMLYSWTQGLKQESKIREAYQMLKSQGIIKQDPTQKDAQEHLPQGPLPAPPPPRQASIFGNDEEKGKQLSRLLKSRNPADLAAANRMIKTMVKEDNDRVERLSKRMSELETVRNNTKLLSEMLQHYHANGGAVEDTEIMRELYQTLEAARPNLVRLARETDENDNDGITEILQVNDSALEVIKRFEECGLPKTADRSEEPGSAEPSGHTAGAGGAAPLNDLLTLDNGDPPPYTPAATVSEEILSRDLAALGLGSPSAAGAGAAMPKTTPNSVAATNNHTPPPPPSHADSASRPDSALLSDLFAMPPPTGPPRGPAATATTVGPRPYHALSQAGPASGPRHSEPPAVASTAFDDLGLLGKEWVEQRIKPEQPKTKPTPDVALVDLEEPSGVRYAPLGDPFTERLRVDLTSLDLPISDVRPDTKRLPATLFERPGGMRMQLHFTENRPALNVRSFVAMLSSAATQPVTKIRLEVEPVSSGTRLDLKPASATELSPFSPFAPQVAVTQIMLAETVNEMDPIVIRYRLHFSLGGGAEQVEEGESCSLTEGNAS